MTRDTHQHLPLYQNVRVRSLPSFTQDRLRRGTNSCRLRGCPKCFHHARGILCRTQRVSSIREMFRLMRQIWLKMSFFNEWSRFIIIDPPLTIISQQQRIHQISKRLFRKNEDQRFQSHSCFQLISHVKMGLTRLLLIKRQMIVYNLKPDLYQTRIKCPLWFITVSLN